MGNIFSNIGLNVQNTLKDRYKEPDDSGTNDRCKQPDFKFEPYTSEELVKIVKSLKSNSAGVDGLSLSAFKVVAGYTIPCLFFYY